MLTPRRETTEFARRILAWYEQHARPLPWRLFTRPGEGGPLDSYAVWVSEIMLQQTRVETVIPYFTRWMERFPNLGSLAAAPEQEVLAAWEGLGYYRRARNLQRAAQIVVSQHEGRLPSDRSQLRALPGIGRYTAAAILALAYGQDVASLDSNLKRILARVFDVSLPSDTPAGENALWKLAEAHLPQGRAADYNQGLMDLGATICLPKKPRCVACPLNDLCAARALGLQEQRPVTRPKAAIPHKFKAAAVIVWEGKSLLNRRPAGGLLGGLWEFPAAEVTTDSETALVAAIEAAYALRVLPLKRLSSIHHAYTHFRLTESPWLCQLAASAPPPSLHWAPLASLPAYPMGKVDRAIARCLVEI